MTLLIALMGNDLVSAVRGEPFIDVGWIVVIWILHLLTVRAS